MAAYERSRRIQASPDDVFAFVSNIGNLAAFVPTVIAAEPQEKGRVRIRGKVHERTYVDDGWFHVEDARRRVEWGPAVRFTDGSSDQRGACGGTRSH